MLPSQQEELSYSDWYKMVDGLMPDTPLGAVVQIRAEKDPKRIKQFSPAQRRLRSEWAHFVGQKKRDAQDEQSIQKQMQALQQMFAGMFSK